MKKHDDNLAALYKIFNPTKTDFFFIQFGAGFIFELRNDTKGNYYVQLLLKNSKPTDPIELKPISIEGTC